MVEFYLRFGSHPSVALLRRDHGGQTYLFHRIWSWLSHLHHLNCNLENARSENSLFPAFKKRKRKNRKKQACWDQCFSWGQSENCSRKFSSGKFLCCSAKRVHCRKCQTPIPMIGAHVKCVTHCPPYPKIRRPFHLYFFNFGASE